MRYDKFYVPKFSLSINILKKVMSKGEFNRVYKDYIAYKVKHAGNYNITKKK